MKTYPVCHIGNTRLVAVRNPELARAQRRTEARRRRGPVRQAAFTVAGWFRG